MIALVAIGSTTVSTIVALWVDRGHGEKFHASCLQVNGPNFPHTTHRLMRGANVIGRYG